METKICKICNIEKNVLDFYKRPDGKNNLRNECKICLNKNNQKWHLNNKTKILNDKKESYIENKEKIKNSVKIYQEKHKEKYVIYQRFYNKEFRKLNKEFLNNKSNEYQKNRRKNDSTFKLIHNIRNRVRDFLKSKNITKNNKTFDIVGCSPEFLKEHIEKQFTDGMSWDLMGEHIHIDHIIPLSSANTEDEVYKLCHYTNLQPLWAEDNLKKYNKII